MFTLSEHAMTPAFRARSLRPGHLGMGHVLNVDHFWMSQPTFPPHPHAGFSAVTVMLPWSPGAFVNRDSKGDRSRLGPGSLHWTLAGSGMMHEEIPEVPGQDCQGLQIFVKLPEAMETTTPAAFHLDEAEIPRVAHGQSEVRVLVGASGEALSPMPSHADTTLLLARVRGPVALDVPPGVEAFALALRGGGVVNGAAVAAHTALPLPSGPTALEAEDSDLLVAWSAPMPRVPTFQGPFCMFRPERLRQAYQDYQRGAMGHLEPSPVTFVR